MPDKFHFMPDEFHFMPDKFHLMPDPTGIEVAAVLVLPFLLNERSFSIMQKLVWNRS
jgi:hypothetical protein